jgi:hypothetical protein
LIVKSKKGEMQMGGVIYNDSADKAARFIMNCNQKKIPLVFLQDVTGFMVGSRSEHSGIIKDGAKLVNAVVNSVVPKITIIVAIVMVLVIMPCVAKLMIHVLFMLVQLQKWLLWVASKQLKQCYKYKLQP